MQYEILYTTHRTCTCHRKFIDDSKHHENEILGLAKRWKINIPAISDLASMGKPTSHFPGDRGQATKMFQDRRSGFTKKSIRKAASRRRSSKRKTQLQNDDKAWQTFKASEFKSEVQVYFSTCYCILCIICRLYRISVVKNQAQFSPQDIPHMQSPMFIIQPNTELAQPKAVEKELHLNSWIGPGTVGGPLRLPSNNKGVEEDQKCLRCGDWNHKINWII